MLETFRRRYPNHVRITEVTRQGAPQARNAALGLARGEWVQCLDADDYLEDSKIATQLESVRPETEWVIGAFRNLWPDGSTSDDFPHADPWKGLVFNHLVGHTNANLYRRDLLERVGGWNESTPLYDDPNLHFKLLRTEAHYLIDPRISSYYRHHHGQRVTSDRRGEQSLQAVELIERAIAHLRANRPDYFSSNRSYFYGALLRQLRILATRNLTLASALYRIHFPDPSRSERLMLVPTYTRLYPLLGFRRLENWRRKLSAILPDTWKQRLKR
jgi:glycosyltransferase involved in cell wall biosynthesis